MKVLIVGAVFGLTACGVGFASPANAGCEPRPIAVTYCDGPIQADGSWRRCFYNSPFFMPGRFGGFSPGGGNCYNVSGPGGDPYPWAPQEWLVGTGDQPAMGPTGMPWSIPNHTIGDTE